MDPRRTKTRPESPGLPLVTTFDCADHGLSRTGSACEACINPLLRGLVA